MNNSVHRKINNVLSIIIIVLAIYIFVTPFLPAFIYKYKQATSTDGGYVYQSQANPKGADKGKPVPQDNRIVIPGLLLDEPIKESKSIGIIDNGGTWRRPKTSSPDKGGNTVIIAHRYTYKGASTFYNLDKVATGNKILVYWQGKEHIYRVTEVKVISPKDTSVEQPTDDKRLTLYTCTPLWHAKDRLVITALPEGDI
jgi:LPXTG-site transpeptidase (sortase) family protein